MKDRYKLQESTGTSSAALKEHLISNGFLWGPESNPYGVSGLISYGPVGKELKLNLEAEFRRVFRKEGFDEIETPVLYPTETWEASGHIPKFSSEMFTTQTHGGRELQARPEIATTIYPLFNQLLKYYGSNLPFKVYQTGVVLPNDRQTEWQTRTRQYTAHEGHIFFETRQVNEKETIAYLKGLASELMMQAGIQEKELIFREKAPREKPFYAKSAYGLYTQQEGGKELELLGVQYRSSGDLEKHSKATAIPLKIRSNYPEVFEISFSTDRPFFILLGRALKTIDGRTVLQLPDHLAPIPAMVLPLENVPDLNVRASILQQVLRRGGIDCPIIEGGHIGKRYKKADALGVPYVFTVDQVGLKDDSFALRQRDSRIQVRATVSDINSLFPDHETSPERQYLVGKLFKVGKSKKEWESF